MPRFDNRIKEVDNVELTLSQVNSIARMADAIGEDKNGWSIAISSFKKSHKISGGKWVKDNILDKEISSAYVTKQDNGTYWITAVSTAAIKDREGETFTTAAIDYDMNVAKETGVYPQFRVFHSGGLGIGQVSKMSRVGIFAIDEGSSYNDAFSLDVCEKMLSRNADGKWRVSRGFRVLEASGICPDCGEDLLIRTKHMAIGFRCPTCNSIQLGSKGSLGNLKFLKAKTFDITVTDVPAVPWTGVSAFPIDLSYMEVGMNKKELRTRLLKAGLDELKVDERLEGISEDTLKEFDNIPEAILLKEFSADAEESETTIDSDNVFTLDESVLKEFSKIVAKQVSEVVSMQLDGLTVEVEEDELKENSKIVELQGAIDELKELVELLIGKKTTVSDEVETPRNGLRVLRAKAFPPKKDGKNKFPPDEESDEDSSDDEDADNAPVKKVAKEYGDDVLIVGANGKRMKSMTDFVTSGGD
jgi:hypothetical protein